MTKRTITIELPAHLAPVAHEIEKMAAEAGAQIDRALEGGEVDMASIERMAEEASRRIEAELLRGVLQSLDIDRERVSIGGKAHTRVGRYEATYRTKAGPVSVTRSLYREVGVRNGPTVDAVGLRAGAVADGWLPETAKAMAFLIQQGTSREAEATAQQLGRLPYSRSSFERVGHAVGALYVTGHLATEDRLVKELAVPQEAASVSVSLDRVAVAMEEPRPRPVGRPAKDAPTRPITRAFRMAYCGTVTLHDARGEALHTLRYGRMPQGDANSLCAGLAGDVLSLLEKRPELNVAMLLDGAPELANRLHAELDEHLVGKPIVDLIDFWHVMEKLAAAAAVLTREAAERTRSRWKLALLNSSTAAGRILDELRRSGMEHVSVGEGRPVHNAITYLENNQHRMDYAAARRRGLPIGSGNVEATCKSLVGVRMKRPGARWKESTGEHVIQLRALALSDRWDRGIQLTLAPLRRAVS